MGYIPSRAWTGKQAKVSARKENWRPAGEKCEKNPLTRSCAGLPTNTLELERGMEGGENFRGGRKLRALS